MINDHEQIKMIKLLLITSWDRETVVNCVEGVQVKHEVLGVDAIRHQGPGHLVAPLLHLGPHTASLQGRGHYTVDPRTEERYLEVIISTIIND